MKQKDMLAIDGVFVAVKCAICDTLYPADSDDFVAFYGSVTAGLDDVIIGVTPPKRPAKKAVTCVCRTPACVGSFVRGLLGVEGDGKKELWSHALSLWAEEAGHKLSEADAEPPKAVELKPKAKLKAKSRR